MRSGTSTQGSVFVASVSRLDAHAVKRAVANDGVSGDLEREVAEALAAEFRAEGFDVTAMPRNGGLWAIYREREEPYPSRADYFYDWGR